MDSFCGSPFWDVNIVWNTEDPNFTPCFENTVLVWAPCLFLWLCAPFTIHNLIARRRNSNPWSFLIISKFVFTLLLIFLALSEVLYSILKYVRGERMFLVEFCSPVIKLVTFALCGVLLLANKAQGVISSSSFFFFWLLLSICGIPQLKTELRRLFSEDTSVSIFSPTVFHVIQLPAVLSLFLLNCFADVPPKPAHYSSQNKNSPEVEASFLSTILFSWLEPFVWKGFWKPHEFKDLWTLQEKDTLPGVLSRLQKNYPKSDEEKSRVYDDKNTITEEFDSLELKSSITKNPDAEISIWKSLFKAYWGNLLFSFSLKFTGDILNLMGPKILEHIIDFMGTKEYTWHGYFYVFLLFANASAHTLLHNHYWKANYILGLRIRIALMANIYRKALKISNSCRKEQTLGETVNLMAVDVSRFLELMPDLAIAWSTPLQISLAVYFLWNILGPSVIAGILVITFILLLGFPLGAKNKALFMKIMKYKDQRVKIMNEILVGMKVIKLYAWEDSFEKHVTHIRGKEVKTMKRLGDINACASFIMIGAPVFMALSTFWVYLWINNEYMLDAKRIFVSLALFNLIKVPLFILPLAISNWAQAFTAYRRISKFMNNKELDPNCVTHHASEENPLVIRSGIFGWESNIPVLHDIDIEIPKYSLVAIAGAIGSGKSSLLSAFLGEMERLGGYVNTKGSIAYVSQQAWIQNATVQENILFGKEFDKRLYIKVIEACALKEDFLLLPAGDQTEIGEKGINLSGGQKQRVNLARAVYHGADVYFFDDPLSAVDVHVGKHIFENVMGPKGLLKKKTRVLVTHGLSYLTDVDKIYVLKDGRISESGSYKELLDRKGAFAELLQTYSQDPVKVPDSDHQLVNSLSPDTIRKRTSSNISGNVSLKSYRSNFEDDFESMKTTDAVNSKLIEEEFSEIGSIKWRVFTHYLGAVGWLYGVSQVVYTGISQIFLIGASLWLSYWSEKSKTDGVDQQNVETRNTFIGGYAFLGIMGGLILIKGYLASVRGSIRASKLMHKSMLMSILHAPLSFCDTTPIGRILSRFSKDVDLMDNALPYEVADIFWCGVDLCGILFIIGYSTPLFIIVFVVIMSFYFVIQRFYGATSRQLKRIESIYRSPIFSHFSETLSGSQIIRAFGVVDRFIQESDRRIDSHQVCLYPTYITSRWLSVRLELIGNLFIFFAGLFAVMQQDTMSPGIAGLSVAYTLQVTDSLNWFIKMLSSFETNFVAVERIKEYGSIEQEAPWIIEKTAPPPNWPHEGKIVFKDFKVRYREGLDLVLKGLNFTVEGGEKVGIVGRTGAGKSSMTLCLFRIIEAAEGAIYIDDIDISTLGIYSLRSRLTIIPQDPVLFAGSLRLNLDPHESYSDPAIWRVLELAHLKEFVKSQQGGLYHEVVEGGENLSVGQKQLICLARALLRKTKILILDEATAAVDVETDDLIQSTIRKEFSDCTILTIAHRLNTILESDKILVLDEGLISEYDSPSVLLKNTKSTFYSMVKNAGLLPE